MGCNDGKLPSEYQEAKPIWTFMQTKQSNFQFASLIYFEILVTEIDLGNNEGWIMAKRWEKARGNTKERIINEFLNKVCHVEIHPSAIVVSCY